MINQNNLSFEKNTPKNDIHGVLQAYLFATHAAVAGTSRALFPIVDQEMRRMMQENANKPVNPAPEIVQSAVRPTATEMLAQVATNQHQQQAVEKNANILTSDPEDPELMADNLRDYINTLHGGGAPIVQPIPEPTSRNPEDYDLAS